MTSCHVLSPQVLRHVKALLPQLLAKVTTGGASVGHSVGTLDARSAWRRVVKACQGCQGPWLHHAAPLAPLESTCIHLTHRHSATTGFPPILDHDASRCRDVDASICYQHFVGTGAHNLFSFVVLSAPDSNKEKRRLAHVPVMTSP